ncbi:DUF2125 domain-containing protein [Arenibacterium sp. LLYu02]|uniref:DUF2125 domain-containing protein n=1 Tax=Arenibacterium sp. LLYu02 TaxID=3404132 RepID=UPI003B20BD68
MSVSPLRGLGLFAPALFIAQAAHADLSAQDVWADWKEYLSSTGYAVTATEDQSGGTLTVSDIQMTIAIEGDTMLATLGTLTFVENGDGTVNVLMPTEMPMGFSMTADGEAFKGQLIYTHDGSPMVVSGDASEMTYVYKAATAGFALAGLEVDGAPVPADVANFSVDLTDVASTTVMTTGAQRAYQQSVSSGSATYNAAFNDPEGEGNAAFNGAISGLEFTGDAVVPTVDDPTDMVAMMNAGLSYGGTFKMASGTSSTSFNDGAESFMSESAFQSADVAIKMGPNGVAMDVKQNDTTLNVMGSEIPFPIALEMAELGVNFAMPLMANDEEQDFALGLALRDFSVPEMLWGLVDPTGELPHDPATLVVDLSGKGKLDVDLMDEATMAKVEMGEVAPGELRGVTLNALQLTVAGAELTGSGDFTFDNTDLESFDGMPAPEGEANLKLTGANTLIDKLVGMGLVTEDDAMGARMMMGMFTVAAGDDTVTSKIEVNDEGHVLANGQRLK